MREKFTVFDSRLYAYLIKHQSREHPELQALQQRTASHAEARMQISPEQGHLLALMVRLIGARTCLEVGTFTGYSTLAIALALPPDGRIVACDINAAWTDVGREYWQRAGVASKIDLMIAPAIETLARLEREKGPAQFDLAFIDADKTAYDNYYEAALRLVRPAGLIILDNMLRRGRVADPSEIDPDTVALRRLNAKLAGDDRVDCVLLPIASGMTLARRR
jgi:predicted O-methyltransferase YrrM